MTEDEVGIIVKGLATKNCEMDPIPPALLKESLHDNSSSTDEIN